MSLQCIFARGQSYKERDARDDYKKEDIRFVY